MSLEVPNRTPLADAATEKLYESPREIQEASAGVDSATQAGKRAAQYPLSETG
jgi:hypothetical protein